MKYSKPPWKFLGEENAPTMLTEAGPAAIMFVRIISGNESVFLGASTPRSAEEMMGNIVLLTAAPELYEFCVEVHNLLEVTDPGNPLLDKLNVFLTGLEARARGGNNDDV